MATPEVEMIYPWDKNDWTREFITPNNPPAPEPSPEEIYADIIPGWFERFYIKYIDQKLCFHNSYILSKYKLVRSLKDEDKGTSREFQYIHLKLADQKWKCFHCGKLVGCLASIPPRANKLKNKYKEEYYL